MAKYQAPLHPDAPLLLNSHRRPMTRRELIAQGFRAGGVTLAGGSLFSLLSPSAMASLSADIADKRTQCGIASQGAGKIPFICFDLAGGANIAGSNVLVGQKGGLGALLGIGGEPDRRSLQPDKPQDAECEDQDRDHDLDQREAALPAAAIKELVD